jgi:hypothetical protein
VRVRHGRLSGDADKLRMVSLARFLAGAHLHVVDVPCHLSSWGLDGPSNTALWADDSGRLRAWAVMQMPFWTVDYLCDPNDQDLHRQILARADERARAIRCLPPDPPGLCMSSLIRPATSKTWKRLVLPASPTSAIARDPRNCFVGRRADLLLLTDYRIKPSGVPVPGRYARGAVLIVSLLTFVGCALTKDHAYGTRR